MSIIVIILLLGVGIRIVATMVPSMDVVPVVEDPDLFSRRVVRAMREADRVLADYSPYYAQLSPAGKLGTPSQNPVYPGCAQASRKIVVYSSAFCGDQDAQSKGLHVIPLICSS